ncbi:protein kinase [Streptosporangium sp. NPDC048047]|uniref:serine/threonine-protein kinase n=1 Tax=Streptosporangium sp. NPDC048047 TaxID=3155748 RepID=UPI00343B02EA
MYGTSSAWRVPGYTEIRELGAGAAGRVMMARHDADDVLVAIKYLSDRLRGDVGFVARFRHEARVLYTLDSPHAVRLYDYVETGEGAAIVMELVNGVPLRAVLRSEGPTGPEAALTVLKGALTGLAAAHKINVVHRDFKPENVLIEPDGTSRLVDFGIAVRSGEGDVPAGTPPYMAPEQWSGGPASPATDVYAATAVFFECLTGARPFRGTNIAALARQHQSMAPPTEEVPSALRGLVERGLAKHETDRPPTAIAFLTELEAVAADAYGPDWEERGRRRLAALAGIMASLLPFPRKPATSEAHTSLAETDLGDPVPGGTGSDGYEDLDLDDHGWRAVMSRRRSKILVGVGCVALIGVIGMVLVNSSGSSEIQARSSAATASATPSEPVESITPGETDEPQEETSEEPTAKATPSPSATDEPPAATSAASPPPVPPARRPTARPSRATAKPSATPTRTRRPHRPAPSRKPSPSATATDEETSDIGGPGEQPTRTSPPRATSTPQTSAPQATRPPRPPKTESPSPTEGGGETNPSPTRSGGAGLTFSPTPSGETASTAFLALGALTGGAVPFAAGRGTAGRRRGRPDGRTRR